MCKCNHQPRVGAVSPPAGSSPELGELGMLLLTASGQERTGQWGPVTGAYYPFDERPSMWVDRRDAIYLVGTDLRFA